MVWGVLARSCNRQGASFALGQPRLRPGPERRDYGGGIRRRTCRGPHAPADSVRVLASRSAVILCCRLTERVATDAASAVLGSQIGQAEIEVRAVQATIDLENLAGYVRTRRRRQKEHRGSDLLGVGDSPNERALLHLPLY